MKIACGLCAATLALLISTVVSAPDQRPKMAEDVFKNIQVLKSIPVNQFIDTMGFFSAALGLNCTGCHVARACRTSISSLKTFHANVRRAG
jgi:hypothetical protein